MTMDSLEISATRLERVLHCPASYDVERALPRLPQTDASKEGDAAHEVAYMILSGQVTTALELVDRKMSNGVYVTADMADHVVVLQEYLEGKQEVFCERQLDASLRYEHEHTLKCVIDAWWFENKTSVEIIDFKYGWKPVEVYPNFQLIGYAIALKQWVDIGVTEFKLTIVQPRPYHRDGRVRSVTLSAGTINDYAVRIAQTLENRNVTEAKTGNHCRGCRGYFTCSAAQAASYNAVDVAETHCVDDLTPEAVSTTVRDLRRAQQVVKQRLEAVEDLGLQMLRKGQPVPGYMAQAGQGNYKWNEGVEPEFIHALTGVSPLESKIVTPAQLKKRGADPDVVKALTHRPSTGFKLVEKGQS